MQEKNNGEVYLATTESEKDKGQYSWLKTPKKYNTVITVLK